MPDVEVEIGDVTMSFSITMRLTAGEAARLGAITAERVKAALLAPEAAVRGRARLGMGGG